MKEVGKKPFPNESFPEHEWWNIWVLMLITIMRDHGLPYQARKDSDKRKQESPSPFVSFISELQKHMPVECRKYTHSLDALSQAIYRARRDLRKVRYLGEIDRNFEPLDRGQLGS